MKYKLKIHFPLLILALVLLCPRLEAAPLKVFVSIPPQKWLCEKLGGELLQTNVLVDKGQDPHTFEPTPRQVAALFSSKVYFTLDLDFEGRILEKISKTASGLLISNSAEGIVEEEDHKDEHRADHKDEHREHHDHGEEDPHIWLSPMNLKSIASNMTKTLMEVDADHAEVYQRNLISLNRELDQLHATLQNRLNPYKGASFYVFHPAFGHFARSYDLIQVPVEIEGKSPRPKQLAKLIGKAKQEGVKIIFVQPQFDTKSAMAVASGIGGEVLPLDALGENVAASLEEMSVKIEKALRTSRK